MRPSISVSLEPGLERGVPWGRDLYTFVTSAAGHMMRTLQKPRKSRPSKRQVNHRRFLHNMIQRKFADIEAANHRLASAIYFKDGEKNTSSLLSHNTETSDPSVNTTQSLLQEPNKHRTQTDSDGILNARTDASVDLYEIEISEKKQPDLGHLWKLHPKSQSSTSANRVNSQSKKRQKKEKRIQKLTGFPFISSTKDVDYFQGAEFFDSGYHPEESQPKPASNLLEETRTHPDDSKFILSAENKDFSPSFSPDLSPLSVDSCDFSIQMFTDLSPCIKTQKSIAESQLTDITDHFAAGTKDSESCMDVEAYFQSICAYQSDAGLDVCADTDFGFADPSDNFTGVKDLQSVEGEYRYGYGCHGDQELTTNYPQSKQRSSQTLRQSKYSSEMQFNHFKPAQSADITQNQLPTPISYNYNAAQLQTHQTSEEGHLCKLVNYENNFNCTSFEGVAQSFAAPPHEPVHRAIPTPPHEDDWLFTDILMDRKSPDYL